MPSPITKTKDCFNDLTKQLIEELRAMVQFASARGEKVPAQALILIKSYDIESELSSDAIKKLVHTHGVLSNLVKPAIPRNIVYLQERNELFKKGHRIFKARFPFQQKLAIFSSLSIVVLILCGQSDLVNSVDLGKGILDSSGMALLINFIYLCSSAAIGASFLILSNLKNKYQDGTYHPDQDVNSWTIILLGIISGIILSQLIPIDEKALESSNSMMHYNRGLFALLGGFSSKLIYDILNKIIVAVGSIVNTDESSTEIDIQKIRLTQEDELNKAKNTVSSQLVALKSLAASGTGSEEFKSKISKAIDSMTEELGVPSSEN